MTETRSLPGAHILRTALFSGLAIIIVLAASQVTAQSPSGVMVNLGVLDDLDPMATVPHLLMPSAVPTRGRIVLTPPPGVDPITPRRSRVVLRPPPGAPARVTSAPTIAIPQPAAAAVAPPTSVTTAPTPAAPPAPVAAPLAVVAEAPLEDPVVEESNASNTEPEISPAVLANAEQDGAEQTASLPPDSGISDNENPVSIVFGMEQTEIPASASTTLNDLAALLNGNDKLRVQLMAYASSADGSPSSVRRKSLSRALSVREFLMDQGVQSTRIEVRALGDQNEGGEPDRVDALIEQR